MKWQDWDPVYERIIADMGYSRGDDEAVVRVLKAVTVNCDLVDPDDVRFMFGDEATVFGDADRLEEDIALHPPAGTLISSGSAVGRLLALDVVPQAVVTDLDGDMEAQLRASSMGAVTFVHAHGDNGDTVRRWAGLFEGPVILTTQSRPESTVFNFGGFTDGDRAVCIAQEMGARTILLEGFDFSNPRMKEGSDPVVKLRKLAWAKEIIGSLAGVEILYPRYGKFCPPSLSCFIGRCHRPDEDVQMSTAYLVLLILFVVYVPIWIWVWRRPESASRWHLQKYGPCIMIKTRLGMRTMDRLARYPRFWHAFGFFSKLVSAVLFLLMMYMLVVAVIALPERLASGSSIGIEYALAIPGFNPILPLSYGIVALFFAMVVHELGHGIQSRVNGIRVDSTGLLYGVVPLGAFVEPNEDDLAAKPRKARIDVYAAGITVNTVFAVISILLLIVSCGFVSSDRGDSAGVYYVDSGSPAFEAEIPASALIIGVSDADGNLLAGEDADGNTAGTLGTTASGTAAYIDFDFDPTQRYVLTYQYKDDVVDTEPVQMGAYIRAITVGSPADDADVPVGWFIYSIEVGDETHQVGGVSSFSDIMDGTVPGQTVTVTLASVMDDDGSCQMNTYTVTLGSNGSKGFLGLTTTTGGMTFTTPDLMIERASSPFYGADSAYSYVTSFFSFLAGPFNGMDPVSDEVKWWYDVPGGSLFWVAMSLLYWIFWLDILLAISNALPTYVLDGGFIFAGGVSWLLEKLGVRDPERNSKLTDSVAGSVSTVTLFLFVLVILAMLI